MARTTEALVKELLLRDYDSRNTPSLTVFIDTASAFIDAAVECAARQSITHTDAILELMETWAAAYFYTQNNPVYASKNTDGRSATFLREGQINPYKVGLLALDSTGCLTLLLSVKKRRAGFTWLGKRASVATNFWDRE